MILRIFGLLFFFMIRCNAQFLLEFNADIVMIRNYIGGDEFNGGRIEVENWFLGFPWGHALLQQDNYVLERNYKFDHGNLIMVVDKLDSTIRLGPYEYDSTYLSTNNENLIGSDSYRFVYSTALLWSKQQYKYGFFEIKFRGVEGKGIWPAFWLYGGNPNHEIDFFELKGERSKQIHLDVHCPSGCSDFRRNIFGQKRPWGHWVKLDESLHSEFNIASGIWTPNSIRWFLNGSLIAAASHNFRLPMNLVVGTGAAKDNGPFKPGPDRRTRFPNSFVVDYIRIYDEGSNLQLSKYQACNVSPDTLTRNATRVFSAEPHRIKRNLKDATTDPVFISFFPQSANVWQIRVLGLAENQDAVVNWLDDAGICYGTNIISVNTEETAVVSPLATSVGVKVGHLNALQKLIVK